MALETCPNFSLSKETLEQLALCDNDAIRGAAMKKGFSLLSGRPAQYLTKAGGRVNLIGEHVDYPDLQFKGDKASHLFSLGGSIQNSFLVALRSRQDDLIRIWHLNAGEGITLKLEDLEELEAACAKEREAKMPMEKRSVPPWAFHTLGTLMERQRRLELCAGYDIALSSNVPHGAGMSNSAANCVALSLALQCDTPELKLKDPMDIVAFARSSENSKFVGGHCGWLDQMLIVLSKAGQLTKIDYAGYHSEHFNSQLPANWQFAALNTNVPHVLAESEYGDRVKELELGIELFRKVSDKPNFGSPNFSLRFYNDLLSELGEAAVELDGLKDQCEDPKQNAKAFVKQCLKAYKSPKLLRHEGKSAEQSLAIIIKRLRHQKSSSLIVPAAGEAAARGDALAFGKLLSAEGKSLRMSGDFQITGDNQAQDQLLDAGFAGAEELKLEVFGRMLGGGGGGNVLFYVNRSDEERYQAWLRNTQARYRHWSRQAHPPGIEATLIEPIISGGATLLR
jgi:galactokinase